MRSLFRPKGWKSILTPCRPEYTCTEPQNRPKSCHFDRIIKQDIIFVYKIKHKTLIEDYKCIPIFFMNDKVVLAVFLFWKSYLQPSRRLVVESADYTPLIFCVCNMIITSSFVKHHYLHPFPAANEGTGNYLNLSTLFLLVIAPSPPPPPG